MAFSFKNFMKKALNPFAQAKGVVNAIKNKDLKGLAAATIPGVGATQSALAGDWKGAVGRSLNPMGEMASAADRLGMPKPPPGAMGNAAQAMGQLGEAEQAFQGAAPSPAAPAAAMPRPSGQIASFMGSMGGPRRRPGGGGGFGGGFGGGGGMDEGLRQLIQNYYAKKPRPGGGGGGEAVGGGGGFA